MPKCISHIALLLLGALLVCRCIDAQPVNDPPPVEDDEDDEYVDIPPTMFGERLYSLVVEFVNGYVTGIQDILDTTIKPFMYLLEKFTGQLDQ